MIGAGGMGEVYRARDSRLNRTVAVKVLPREFSANQKRRERFLREARSISSFTHPNVCQLYDIGSSDGIDYLVMELLDGESLADRLSRGPLPVEQAIRYAIEMARALAAAHRQGIVHRDIKPGNVILTKSGAKLVDFGLATEAPKMVATDATTFVHAPLTADGAVVGTLQYMSPEQVEGKAVDARSDIFSFGAVLFEMVTGRRAFGSNTHAGVISSIMTDDPPAVAPPALDRVVRKCLAKDPDDRWQSAADIATALEWVTIGTAAVSPPHRRWPLAALAVIALAAVAAAIYVAMRRSPLEVIRFDVQSDEAFAHGLDTHFAISPDGRTLVYTTTKNGRNALWLLSMDNATPRLLTDAHNPHGAFWSPDARSIAFFAENELRRIPVSGGDSETICGI
ncbi:MAG TPA: protein kinase, partial [Thermoanaerobaculia bacterium]|nr:protein kinase [Thermoanaerobaculia bacterium]